MHKDFWKPNRKNIGIFDGHIRKYVEDLHEFLMRMKSVQIEQIIAQFRFKYEFYASCRVKLYVYYPAWFFYLTKTIIPPTPLFSWLTTGWLALTDFQTDLQWIHIGFNGRIWVFSEIRLKNMVFSPNGGI